MNGREWFGTGIVVQTSEGEVTVREMQAKSFELVIGNDEVEGVERLIKKNPAFLYYTWDNVFPLGRAISTESVILIDYGAGMNETLGGISRCVKRVYGETGTV